MQTTYKVTYAPFTLQFKQPAKTSRDTLLYKKTWLLKITDIFSGISGIGECSTISGLSIDDENGFEDLFKKVAIEIETNNSLSIHTDLNSFPAIKFGLEMAVKDLENGGNFLLFDTDFTRGEGAIPVNGLVWMADLATMKSQIIRKATEGFRCIKLKIGTYNFDDELTLIKFIRDEYGESIEIRLDANGAYTFEQAMDHLHKLQPYHIHSIEQPIQTGQWDLMASLCEKTPIPIALDEELIGISGIRNKISMLETIKPQYIILKPSMIGGMKEADEWINMANERKVKWWTTSALESNIGLTGIAQWVSQYKPVLAQGLGIGTLYLNNFDLPVVIEKGFLRYNTAH